MRAAITSALKTVLAEGFGDNHSLCHGDLGNRDILLLARDTLGDPALTADLDRLTRLVVHSAENTGFVCGVSLNVETPEPGFERRTEVAGHGGCRARLAPPEAATPGSGPRAA